MVVRSVRKMRFPAAPLGHVREIKEHGGQALAAQGQFLALLLGEKVDVSLVVLARRVAQDLKGFAVFLGQAARHADAVGNRPQQLLVLSGRTAVIGFAAVVRQPTAGTGANRRMMVRDGRVRFQPFCSCELHDLQAFLAGEKVWKRQYSGPFAKPHDEGPYRVHLQSRSGMKLAVLILLWSSASCGGRYLNLATAIYSIAASSQAAEPSIRTLLLAGWLAGWLELVVGCGTFHHQGQ